MKKLLIFILSLSFIQVTLCPTEVEILGTYMSENREQFATYFEDQIAADQVGRFVSAYYSEGLGRLLSKTQVSAEIVNITFTGNGIRLH
jgi:hypothetical protein